VKTSTTLEQLIRSPELPFVVRELNDVLTAEQKSREQFYDELTDAIKAEFINGEMIVHSPARKNHTSAVTRILTLLHSFVERWNLGFVASEKALICLTRNDYEPDIVFFSKEKSDTLSDDTMKFPAPDFIVEVLSESTAHRDRGLKMSDYALHGVREYWIIDADAETVEQYALAGSEYQLRVKLTNGLIRSVVVEGFEIPVRAIFESGEHQNTLRAILE